MTDQAWWALLAGLVLGIPVGFRLGTWWLPGLIGRMEAWGLRGNIKRYKRRKR